MNTLFPAPSAPLVPIIADQGEKLFYPVSRIFCVGKNYAAHAREMGSDPKSEPPFYFSKSPAHLTLTGATVPYALSTNNLHYEMELVVVLGASAFRVSPAEATAAIFGYACGLDMTRRDLQTAFKSKGQPWDVAKNFEHAAIISPIMPAKRVPDINRAFIRLSVNGVGKQSSHISEMTWNIAEVVSNLSQFYHLQAGDLIYTGTPEGVGPVVAGDVLQGVIEGVGEINLTISKAE